jgi:mono/diheme cytochrome c family protein
VSSSIKTVAVLGIVCVGVGIPALAEDPPGAGFFRGNCVICHGGDASGNTALGKKFKVRDLKSPDVQKATDAELFDVISKGKKPMPGFADRLKDEQIRQIIAYIRDLAKK